MSEYVNYGEPENFTAPEGQTEQGHYFSINYHTKQVSILDTNPVITQNDFDTFNALMQDFEIELKNADKGAPF